MVQITEQEKRENCAVLSKHVAKIRAAFPVLVFLRLKTALLK